MAMDFDGQEMRKGFQAAFGYSIEQLSEKQVRWIVNVAKHCRVRCRSNAALNNYLNRNFIGHSFREVQAPDDKFPHLEIKGKEPDPSQETKDSFSRM